MTKTLLGIDVSTTGVKALLIDSDGAIVDSATWAAKIGSHLSPGLREQTSQARAPDRGCNLAPVWAQARSGSAKALLLQDLLQFMPMLPVHAGRRVLLDRRRDGIQDLEKLLRRDTQALMVGTCDEVRLLSGRERAYKRGPLFW